MTKALRRAIYAVAFSLLLGSDHGHAGIWDLVHKVKGKCAGVGMYVSNRAVKALSTEIKPIIDGIPARAAEVYEQVKQISCTTGNCGVAFSKTLAWQTATVPWRVLWFNSKLDGVRSHMIVPLLGNLKVIRQNKNSNPEEVARAIARLTVYAVETEIKLTRMFAERIVVAPMSMASGVIIPQSASPKGPEEIAKLFVNSVFGHVWNALFAKGLAWNDRLAQLISVEAAVQKFVQDASDAVGLDLVNAELAEWEAQNINGENEPENIEGNIDPSAP